MLWLGDDAGKEAERESLGSPPRDGEKGAGDNREAEEAEGCTVVDVDGNVREAASAGSLPSTAAISIAAEEAPDTAAAAAAEDEEDEDVSDAVLYMSTVEDTRARWPRLLRLYGADIGAGGARAEEVEEVMEEVREPVDDNGDVTDDVVGEAAALPSDTDGRCCCCCAVDADEAE